MSAGTTAQLGTRLRVLEIFRTLQGETSASGRPAAFVRLGGCDLRCRWCDTPESWEGGALTAREDVLAQVAALGCPLVVVTGGEPLLQRACLGLLRELCDAGYEVMLETGGHRDISEVDSRVKRIVDLKPPGSGEVERNRYENLPLLRAGDELKLVLADRTDYEWARALLRETATLSPEVGVLLSPVTGELAPEALAGWILEDFAGTSLSGRLRLQLQLHKILGIP